MKRVAAFLLLAASMLVWVRPANGQIFMGPGSEQKAQKAAKKQQKALNKQARKQMKAMRKYQKAQRKAEKRQLRHAG